LLHVAGVAQQSLPLSNIRSLVVVVAAGAVAAVAPRGGTSSAAFTGTSPYELLASGFHDPSGLAVDSDGSVLVTDRRAGTLTRVTDAGERRIVLRDLHRPRGVAVGADAVFVLEATRLLRMDADGIASVVSAAVRGARAIAADPDGRIWIAVRPEASRADAVMRLEPSGELTPVASGFVDIRAIAADRGGIYVAVASLAGEHAIRTTVARLPRRADGTLGGVESLMRNAPWHPGGVAIDAAGDVFVAGVGLERYSGVGVVLKRRPGSGVSIVAAGLSRPGAAAFGPGRHLFVLERRAPARLLRFRPPPPPAVSVVPFTNHTPVRLAGAVQTGSLVQVRSGAGGLLSAGMSNPGTGAFALTAPVPENRESHLSLTATARGGNGLVGLPAPATVVHDDHLPAVDILEPPAAAHAGGLVVVRARARDEGSGMAMLRLMVDEVPQTGEYTATLGEPLAATAVIDMAPFGEGPHALTAAASDRAGNWATAVRLVVVDRTPPDTFIVAGPPAGTGDRSTGVTFGGSDEHSADLEFAWRVDRGQWSAFSSARTVLLTDVEAGAHLFEVTARDLAGNIDPTPAAQSLTIRALRVRIVEPVPGALITAQTAWVRGSVDGGPDVALSVPLDGAFQRQLGLDALPAPYGGDTFAVEVPVVAGMSGLTVVARDAAGGQSSETVPITVLEPLERSLRLKPSPAAGLAPLSVQFSASGVPAGSAYTLDLESDGIPDDQGNGMPPGVYVFARPGVYVVTLTATAPGGEAVVARGSIEVYDRERLEARLGVVWGGFKAAMRAGDLAAAASFLHRDRRAAWAAFFGRMTPAHLAATDAMFTSLTLVEATPGRAECEMVRDEGGLFYSFPVSFAIDVEGGWKLWQF
jgi:hypothetical protein